jgi:phosphatidate cytidylyltransferase
MNRFLRSLTPDQQISLLFVAVFGALLLASTVAFLLSLRERQHHSDAWWDGLRSARVGLRRSWLMAGVFWLAWVTGPLASVVLFGFVSLLTLREFISLTPTHRSDHKALVLLFFVVLPLQYTLVATRQFNLFSVFIPVYVFLAVPVVSSLGNDPHRFLERNATLQWGTMVCVYGLSHVPALLLLGFAGFEGRSAFLVFFLVATVQTCMVLQHLASRWLRRAPTLPRISDGFNWRSWAVGVLGGALLGALLAGITPFKPGRAFALALVACVAATLGHLVMKAIKRDRGVPHLGLKGQGVTGASGLLDRMDALAFAAPVFFQSVRWTFGV